MEFIDRYNFTVEVLGGRKCGTSTTTNGRIYAVSEQVSHFSNFLKIVTKYEVH